MATMAQYKELLEGIKPFGLPFIPLGQLDRHAAGITGYGDKGTVLGQSAGKEERQDILGGFSDVQTAASAAGQKLLETDPTQVAFQPSEERQAALSAALSAVRGDTTSVAEQQLRRQSGFNRAALSSALASQRGGFDPSTFRAGMSEIAQENARVNQAASLLRAQEQQQSLGLLGQFTGQDEQLRIQAAMANQAAQQQQYRSATGLLGAGVGAGQAGVSGITSFSNIKLQEMAHIQRVKQFNAQLKFARDKFEVAKSQADRSFWKSVITDTVGALAGMGSVAAGLPTGGGGGGGGGGGETFMV